MKPRSEQDRRKNEQKPGRPYAPAKESNGIMKRMNTATPLACQERNRQMSSSVKTVRGRIAGWEARGVPTVVAALAAVFMMFPAATHAQPRYLLVADFNRDSVRRYDAATGAFVDTFVPKH